MNIRRQHDFSSFNCGSDAHVIFFAWNLLESKTDSVRNRPRIPLMEKARLGGTGGSQQKLSPKLTAAEFIRVGLKPFGFSCPRDSMS